ncbi:MAG: LysM peptidoglycan-binding domain-containing protein [Treponema sp.]|jgi:hypothetical protein|nr:LysM peptidoglycan-binding domain-containing protein [Treponema sp.]
MASTIGIKLANGEFYAILEENVRVTKRLTLTTVHDSQRSVQIDLYRSYTRTMADALYIGSIVVNNIRPRPRGESEVDLTIGSDATGKISADAVDLDDSAGEHHYLSVALKTFDEDSRARSLPDFELEETGSPPRELYEKAGVTGEALPKKAFPWIPVLVAGLGLVIILAVVFLGLFLLRYEPPGPVPAEDLAVAVLVQPQEPAPEPVLERAPEPAVPANVPVIEAPPVPAEPIPAPAEPASRTRRNAPVYSYKVPAVIPAGGAPYTIRWGDTLWDISEAFYRNPWLYTRIARYNNIRNPDRIISGTTIQIPPRN